MFYARKKLAELYRGDIERPCYLLSRSCTLSTARCSLRTSHGAIFLSRHKRQQRTRRGGALEDAPKPEQTLTYERGKLGNRSGDLDISGGYETVKCHWACHFPNFRLRSR